MNSIDTQNTLTLLKIKDNANLLIHYYELFFYHHEMVIDKINELIEVEKELVNELVINEESKKNLFFQIFNASTGVIDDLTIDNTNVSSARLFNLLRNNFMDYADHVENIYFRDYYVNFLGFSIINYYTNHRVEKTIQIQAKINLLASHPKLEKVFFDNFQYSDLVVNSEIYYTETINHIKLMINHFIFDTASNGVIADYFLDNIRFTAYLFMLNDVNEIKRIQEQVEELRCSAITKKRINELINHSINIMNKEQKKLIK